MKILDLFKVKLPKDKERELLDSEKPKRVRLGLIVGHDRKEQGAVIRGTDTTEYIYNLDLARVAKNFAAAHVQLGVDVDLITRDGVGIQGAYDRAEQLKCDFVIELHFNSSANLNARGCETLCSVHADDRQFAQFTQERLSKVLNGGSHDRGVKVLSKGDRGAVNVYASYGPSCLIEPFFGSNEADSANALVKTPALAKELVYIAKTYGQKIGLLPI